MFKAFDKVDHKTLTKKLSVNGFGERGSNPTSPIVFNKLLFWGEPWTIYLPLLASLKSQSLNPCYSYFLWRLPDAAESSRIATFADNTKLFKTISSYEDISRLQIDLDSVNTWAVLSGMVLNNEKVTWKRQPTCGTYAFDDLPLQTTMAEKDFGIWVINNLTWSHQVIEQCTKANRAPSGS